MNHLARSIYLTLLLFFVVDRIEVKADEEDRHAEARKIWRAEGERLQKIQEAIINEGMTKVGSIFKDAFKLKTDDEYLALLDKSLASDYLSGEVQYSSGKSVGVDFAVNGERDNDESRGEELALGVTMTVLGPDTADEAANLFIAGGAVITLFMDKSPKLADYFSQRAEKLPVTHGDTLLYYMLRNPIFPEPNEQGKAYFSATKEQWKKCLKARNPVYRLLALRIAKYLELDEDSLTQIYIDGLGEEPLIMQKVALDGLGEVGNLKGYMALRNRLPSLSLTETDATLSKADVPPYFQALKIMHDYETAHPEVLLPKSIGRLNILFGVFVGIFLALLIVWGLNKRHGSIKGRSEWR